MSFPGLAGESKGKILNGRQTHSGMTTPLSCLVPHTQGKLRRKLNVAVSYRRRPVSSAAVIPECSCRESRENIDE